MRWRAYSRRDFPRSEDFFAPPPDSIAKVDTTIMIGKIKVIGFRAAPETTITPTMPTTATSITTGRSALTSGIFSGSGASGGGCGVISPGMISGATELFPMVPPVFPGTAVIHNPPRIPLFPMDVTESISQHVLVCPPSGGFRGQGGNMIEQAIRVRVDIPERGRIDVMAPAHVPVADLVPEILDLAASNGIADTDGRWRLRLPGGSTADPMSTLASLQVTHGDRLTLDDEAEILPEPMITDVSDVLADGSNGVGVVDVPVACGISSIAVAPLAVAVYLSAATAPVWSAGVAGVLSLAAAVALFVTVSRGAPVSVQGVLCWQVAVLTGTAGIAVAGTSPESWEFAGGLSLGLVIAAGLTGCTGTKMGSAACAAAAFGASVVAGLRFWLDDPGVVWALTVTVGLLSVVAAPTVAVAFARVRVPAVPAAGEPFPSDGHTTDPHTSASHAGSLIDGYLTAISAVTAVAASAALLTEPSGWTYALVSMAIVVMVIQSRGHARKVPSAALLTGASVIVMAAAWHFWTLGWWPVAIILVLVPASSTALAALSGDRITPLTRRLIEIAETAAIAASIPLAAVIAEVPRLLQAVLS